MGEFEPRPEERGVASGVGTSGATDRSAGLPQTGFESGSRAIVVARRHCSWAPVIWGTDGKHRDGDVLILRRRAVVNGPSRGHRGHPSHPRRRALPLTRRNPTRLAHLVGPRLRAQIRLRFYRSLSRATGATVRATVPVTPNQKLYVEAADRAVRLTAITNLRWSLLSTVGGNGCGGGGGGASDVRTCSMSTCSLSTNDTRQVVAGDTTAPVPETAAPAITRAQRPEDRRQRRPRTARRNARVGLSCTTSGTPRRGRQQRGGRRIYDFARAKAAATER